MITPHEAVLDGSGAVVDPPSPAPEPTPVLPTGGSRAAATPAVAAAVGVALGVATAYGQFWLPSELASLANSSGSWSLVAFVVALRARTPRIAALCGALALAGLLAGYVLGAEARGDPSSRSLMVFWGLAALTAGPVLGLSAHWCARAGDRLVAVGAGVMSGVLVGEGVWALASVADTTYPPYWWAEIVVGLVLLAAVTRRLTGASVVLAVVVTAGVAAAFFAVYGLDLIRLV